MKSKSPGSKPPESDTHQDSLNEPVDQWASETVLPLRRSLANESVADHTKQIGLRIESNVERQSQSDEDPALRLEIQEINGSTMRLEEAIPSPEKVPRVVVFREKGTRVKNPKSDQAADETWGKSKKQSLRWMLYNGGGVIALVVLMIALLPLVRSIQRPTPKLKEVKLQIDTKTENEENELGAMSFFIGKEKEAMGLLDRYLHASSIDDVIPLVVDGESQREIIGRHWKPLKDLQSHQLKPDESLEVYHVDDAAYGILRATLPDQSIYIAYFAKLGDRLLLDWKASSKYSSASFEELVAGHGDASEVRGKFTIFNYYTYAWPESVYQCFRLISPDNDYSIWCYIRRDDQALMSKLIFQNSEMLGSTSPDLVTVRLERGPSEALPNQWQIKQLLHRDWIKLR